MAERGLASGGNVHIQGPNEQAPMGGEPGAQPQPDVLLVDAGGNALATQSPDFSVQYADPSAAGQEHGPEPLASLEGFADDVFAGKNPDTGQSTQRPAGTVPSPFNMPKQGRPGTSVNTQAAPASAVAHNVAPDAHEGDSSAADSQRPAAERLYDMLTSGDPARERHGKAALESLSDEERADFADYAAAQERQQAAAARAAGSGGQPARAASPSRPAQAQSGSRGPGRQASPARPGSAGHSLPSRVPQPAAAATGTGSRTTWGTASVPRPANPAASGSGRGGNGGHGGSGSGHGANGGPSNGDGHGAPHQGQGHPRPTGQQAPAPSPQTAAMNRLYSMPFDIAARRAMRLGNDSDIQRWLAGGGVGTPPNNPPSPPNGPSHDRFGRRYEVTQADLDEAHAMDKKYDKQMPLAEYKLSQAMEDYTKLSAERRGNHYGRLEETGRFGRFKSFANRVLHPLQHRKSEQRHEALQTARAKFNETIGDYIALQTSINGERYDTANINVNGQQREVLQNRASMAAVLKARILEEAEGHILQYQEDATQGRDRRNALAARWQRSGKIGKIFKVALPAAAIGVGIGALGFLTAGVVPAALLTGAAGYAGRKYGHRKAQKINRHIAGTQQGQRRLWGDAGRRHAEFVDGMDLIDDRDANVNQLNAVDLTEQTEAGTRQEVAANRRRRGLAGAIGGASAAIAAGGVNYAAGNLRAPWRAFGRGGHGHAAGQATQQQSAPRPRIVRPNPDQQFPASADPTAATPNHVSLPTNSVPWEAAHRAAEQGVIPRGHEMRVVHQAINTWNQLNPDSPLHLAKRGGWDVVVDAAGNPQSPAAQAGFDRFMDGGMVGGWFK